MKPQKIFANALRNDKMYRLKINNAFGLLIGNNWIITVDNKQFMGQKSVKKDRVQKFIKKMLQYVRFFHYLGVLVDAVDIFEDQSNFISNNLKDHQISSVLLLLKNHYYKMRVSRIENELEEIRQLSFTEVVECMPKGLSCITKWILWVPGAQGTLWEGGVYPVQITFPEQYPRVGPIVKFDKEFLHIHVYEGGNICMPILEREYWKSKTTMPDLIQRIINLIHQEVNPYSPANSALYQLYKEDPQKYEETMRQQTNRYKQKDPKYFNEPCIHINIINNDQ